MGISFDKYIDNPSGGSYVYTNRNMYKQMYKDKFDKILLREQGRVIYELYKVNDKKDTHYIYMKIPSEVVPQFYYDVVIQLSTTDNMIKNNPNLREYDVKFYSNDPAFVYTFAHSFIKNKLFIEDLKPRMSRQAIKNPAKSRNPRNEVWYVKSLFFAYLAMERYHLFSKSSFRNAKDYDKKALLRKIMNADDKVALRQSEGEKIRKQNKKEESKTDNTKRNSEIATKQAGIVKTPKVGKVSKVARKSKITGKRKK